MRVPVIAGVAVATVGLVALASVWFGWSFQRAAMLAPVIAACEAIRAAIAERKRICVHGDYDVDGICATALALLILRELGADAEWHLPSRFDEGYGLASATLERLAEDGCGLVLTVDCGIT